MKKLKKIKVRKFMETNQQNNVVNIETMLEERLSLLPQILRAFLLDGSKQNTIKKLVNGYPELSNEQKRQLRNNLFLTLLLFIEIDQLKYAIKEDLEISERLANIITKEFILVLPVEVTSILAEPIEKNLELEVSKEQVQEKAADQFTNLPKNETGEVQETKTNQPEPAPVKIEAAKPLQTMADDMKRAHSYGTTHIEPKSTDTDEEPVYQSTQPVLKKPEIKVEDSNHPRD